jgi:hypothetical protein
MSRPRAIDSPAAGEWAAGVVGSSELGARNFA